MESIKKHWRQILEGFRNFIFRENDVEYISKKRMKYCKSCNHNKKGKCDICGCILEIKTRSLTSTCALEEMGMYPKWKAVK